MLPSPSLAPYLTSLRAHDSQEEHWPEGRLSLYLCLCPGFIFSLCQLLILLSETELIAQPRLIGRLGRACMAPSLPATVRLECAAVQGLNHPCIRKRIILTLHTLTSHSVVHSPEWSAFGHILENCKGGGLSSCAIEHGITAACRWVVGHAVNSIQTAHTNVERGCWA